MYAFAKTKLRVWLKLSWINKKLVSFCQNPLKYVTFCCNNFGLLSANRNPYFGRSRNFTKTPNVSRYRTRNFSPSLLLGSTNHMKNSTWSSFFSFGAEEKKLVFPFLKHHEARLVGFICFVIPLHTLFKVRRY